jgi:competence protein ComEC
LWVASKAAGLPVMGWMGTVVVLMIGYAATFKQTRMWVVTGAFVGLVLTVRGPVPVEGPAVIFFDVGQGDSAIVIGPNGETVLFDSGPDPVMLVRKLREYGVDHLDLVVLSHRHLDHVGGLLGAIGEIPIGEVWHAQRSDEGAFGPVKLALDAHDIYRRTPSVGEIWRVKGLQITVLGPLRHYANPNDESVVALVESGSHRILFSGDVEVIAQRELGAYGATILKVPHQGAATSDRDWLLANVGQMSVVPVGTNTYGHPADWVIELLEASGSLVCRTDKDGDIVVDLESLASSC